MKPKHWYIISFLALLIDQLAKLAAAKVFINQPFLETGKGFGLTFYLNNQFAWSWPLGNYPAMGLALGLLILGGFFYFKFWRAKIELLPIFLIASGAISNLIDRLYRGGVIDYILVPGGGMINLADVFILVGAGLLIVRPKSK